MDTIFVNGIETPVCLAISMKAEIGISVL